MCCSVVPVSPIICSCYYFLSFFFNEPAPTELYTLSLHDALLICRRLLAHCVRAAASRTFCTAGTRSAMRVAMMAMTTDRKSTRLNSSHLGISYAVFCLKKKKIQTNDQKSHIT